MFCQRVPISLSSNDLIDQAFFGPNATSPTVVSVVVQLRPRSLVSRTPWGVLASARAFCSGLTASEMTASTPLTVRHVRGARDRRSGCLPFFVSMALSRFWTFMLILSIAYVLVMLAAGRQYSLGMLINGKHGEALVVSELDTTALQGTSFLRSLRAAGEEGVAVNDDRYAINGTGTIMITRGKQPADGLFATCRNTIMDLWLPLIGYLTFFCGLLNLLIDSRAMEIPRKFFGMARNVEGGGSITVIATALIETGSRLDDLIFEEFKGTGNSEIVLDRQMAEGRVFPAINIRTSGTRREELLYTEDQILALNLLRKRAIAVPPRQAMEGMLKLMEKYPTNDALLAGLKSLPGV